MKTASEFRVEAQRLRDLEKGTTDPQVRAELRALIVELEIRAREMENDA